MPVIKLKVPKLDMSMEEAVISEWFVKTGDTVTKGQEIYSVESDKTTMDVESPLDGVITVIGEAGETYELGAIVAELDAKF